MLCDRKPVFMGFHPLCTGICMQFVCIFTIQGDTGTLLLSWMAIYSKNNKRQKQRPRVSKKETDHDREDQLKGIYRTHSKHAS